jgi:adenosylhomocysteine nucleosidase
VTGLAGSLTPDLTIGDVVVANETLQHDLGGTPISKPYVVPLLDIARFRADPAMTEAATLASEDYLNSKPGDNKVARGLIVTGDRFVQSGSQIADIKKRIPDAVAVEMEGAAVAQVCHYFNVPYALIRTISDGGDEAAVEHFSESLSTLAAEYSSEIVTRMLVALA